MMKLGLKIVFFLFSCSCFAQKNIPSFGINNISDSLKINSDFVVRNESIVVEVKSVTSQVISQNLVMTVLKRTDRMDIIPHVYYDPSNKIKELRAVYYDKNGVFIKEYKKKDFTDVAAGSGVALVDDLRVKYLKYTPTEYPYTVVFIKKTENNSTGFIKSWEPYGAYRKSIEKSEYSIINPKKIKVKFQQNNFQGFPIKQNQTDFEVKYQISNSPSIDYEVYSPNYYDVFPNAKAALQEFTLVGVKGEAKDWNSFGKWQYENLLFGRDNLPKETVEEVKKLIQGLESDEQKARVIYKYVQDKTRYVGIQLGIGGWQPFEAKDVDQTGYGDCKGLSNYTYALLKSQGITSYYTELYAGSKRNVDSTMVCLQGNHAMLYVPLEDKDVWLECTNQNSPFGYIGSFSDDRDVLIIKPTGAEIKHTKKYSVEENKTEVVSEISLFEDQSMVANLSISFHGLNYEKRYRLQFETLKKQKEFYKYQWEYIPGMDISEMNHIDDKKEIVYKQQLTIQSNNYLKKVGSKLLLTPNVFSRSDEILPKIENRRSLLMIRDDSMEKDIYSINLPSEYCAVNIPIQQKVTSKFGEYDLSIDKGKNGELIYRRVLKSFSGDYPKEDYENYRRFRNQIRKLDNKKIVLERCSGVN